MMMQEFIDRTGFEPTPDEYSEIEEAYYRFNGNKDAFCSHWLKTVGLEGIANARAAKIEQMRSTAVETEKELMKTIAERDTEIERLKKQLEREQEWTPYEGEHNVSQADYERLEADGSRRELTDDEAADLIANEFGFDRSKIRIVHTAPKQEINRHRQVRTVGSYDRKALFDVWDYNYILFNVIGNVAMGYEMHNGQLQMYWG